MWGFTSFGYYIVFAELLALRCLSVDNITVCCYWFKQGSGLATYDLNQLSNSSVRVAGFNKAF